MITLLETNNNKKRKLSKEVHLFITYPHEKLTNIVVRPTKLLTALKAMIFQVNVQEILPHPLANVLVHIHTISRSHPLQKYADT